MLPAFVMYKLYKDKDGNFGFYTDITPKPRVIEREEAKRNIEKIRARIKGNDHYMIGCWEEGKQIIEAYIAGIDAVDILDNSDCDASICHEIDNLLFFIEAYQLSKLKPDEE